MGFLEERGVVTVLGCKSKDPATVFIGLGFSITRFLEVKMRKINFEGLTKLSDLIKVSFLNPESRIVCFRGLRMRLYRFGNLNHATFSLCLLDSTPAHPRYPVDETRNP